jgi:nucleotide-binding universal stress UspA family protein
MPQVILIVPGNPQRRNELMAAAQQLSGLIGKGRVIEMVPPASGGAAVGAPDGPVDAGRGLTDLASEVEARGSRADFLVVAQPGPGDDKATGLAFRAALFRTERPVLMVPPGRQDQAFGRRVAIAWRDDPRTLKALVPALRLLSGAEEVHLLAGVRPGTPTPHPPAVLVEHGVPAALHVLSISARTFGELLLDRARELGADMLIMGAHAHTPLRAMLLGGVTSYVVAHADLPVLMRN